MSMPQTIYWCDACRHEDSLTGAAHAHCAIHGTIYNPIGCTDFDQRQKPQHQ